MIDTPGRIDVHTHLLPGIDDGCKTVEQSVACAWRLVGAGYSHAVCTPHVWPTLPANDARRIRERVAALQLEYDRAGVPLTLIPGGELNLQWCWPTLPGLARDEVVTYALAGRWVLFDFWVESAGEVAECVEPGVRHLREAGFNLLLAHPERIAALNRHPAALRRLVDLGVHLQMNSWCLADPPGRPTRDTAERLLREGKYFTLGTDLHDPAGMDARVRGLAVAERLVGRAEFDRLTIVNPRRLIEA